MDLVQSVSTALRDRNMMMATAESCTGGLIAKLMTDLPGSSDIFERGFVTYSNQAKMDLLGVPDNILNTYGAVSEQTALHMASGALQNSHAHIAVSVTGIAGPGGGTREKPVGLVYIGYAQKDTNSFAVEHHFSGSRTEIRQDTANAALNLILKELTP